MGKLGSRTRAVKPVQIDSEPEGRTPDSLEEFTLAEIQKGRGDEDMLIPRLCERTGWDWEQSQNYLQEIRQKDQFRIRINQTRLILIIALVLGLIGAGFIILAYEFQRGSGNLAQCLTFEYTQAWKQIAGTAAFTPCFTWSSALLVDPVLLAVLGIMMIAGSILGALQAIRDWR